MAHRCETNRIPWEVARDTDTIVTGPLTPERGALDVTLESAVHNVAKKEVPCNRKAEEYATPNDAPLKEDSLTPPVLGAFMGETLDPANATLKENAFDRLQTSKPVEIWMLS